MKLFVCDMYVKFRSWTVFRSRNVSVIFQLKVSHSLAQLKLVLFTLFRLSITFIIATSIAVKDNYYC